MSTDPTTLPDVTVLGWATFSHRITGQDGESHPIVMLVLEIQAAPGVTARQTFVFHKEDAHHLRRALKHPAPLPKQPSEEDTNNA